MKIDKVYFGGKEVSMDTAKELVKKYITTHMAMECFMGGVGIQTPEGELIAEVSLAI